MTHFELMTGPTQIETQVTGAHYFPSGTMLPQYNANIISLPMTNISPDISGTFSSGSWEGIATTIDVSSQILGAGQLGLSGTHGGSSTVYNVDDVTFETVHEDLPISDADPNIQEGANSLFWNVFPALPASPPIDRSQRDESRYKKVSSFTREQPVRIRIFRRNTTVR